MSSESSKKTIEKNPQGEYDFTPYGEFLSYFHAHLEIFKRYCKTKNFPSSKMDKDIAKLKSFMASNVKNVDQYFPNIPKFAEILGVSKDQLSEFLNANFLEVLPTVQEKFKKAEIGKLENSPDREFERVTEEILEKTGFIFPAGKIFKQQGMLVVLEDSATGEIIEPQGMMAGISPPPPAVIGADSKTSGANAKPIAVKIIPDHPLLEEIAGIYEGNNSEQKLISENEKEEDPTEAKEEIKASQDDILEDIEDLDFEEPEESESDSHHDYSGVLDDLGDILGHGEEDSESLPDTPPIPEEIINFNIPEYLDIARKIQAFQTQKDAAGYQTWLSQANDLVKVVVAVRSHHLKETKGEKISWDAVINQIEDKSSYDSSSLDLLKEKIINFNWVRIGLDRGLSELKKGSPDLINIVKKAWPHLQSSFYDSPDYTKVLSNLKIIVGKVPNPDHRKEIGRVVTLVLNFLKTKYPS
jgi:transcriptional regulator with XRE-family HTH domain